MIKKPYPKNKQKISDGYCRVPYLNGYVESYFYAGEPLLKEESLWESFGLSPQDFGKNSWNDVNKNDVRSYIPVTYYYVE